MRKGVRNTVKRVLGGVMVAALLFTAGCCRLGTESGISTCGEEVIETPYRS